ncbi:MAG: DUF4332 domain-containing protein [Pseudomonadota bacterium]
MAKKISEIEGIGPTYAENLGKAGIQTVEDLLEVGGTKSGRDKIAQASGCSDSQVLGWVNMADLFRIKGVGGEYAELLECAGVDTVKELAQRNATNLTTKMEEVNAEKSLVRALPAEKSVAGWIEQAKALPQKVTH